MRGVVTAVVLAAFAAIAAAPADAGEGKFKGYMFGDYYYMVANDDEALEKRNAFQFRRIYLTYDNQISDEFSTRLRFEAGDKGFGKSPKYEGGDKHSSKMEPFVKLAYLKWKGAVGGSDLYLGLSGTPTWSQSEKAWGYRSIEKTILDLNKIGSSADLGASLKGKSGNLAYHVMIGNGPGQGPEKDNGKKLYGQVALKATDAVKLVGYADFNMKPKDQNQITLKGFAGLTQDKISGGLEAFTRINKEGGAAGEDETLVGVSVFGSAKLGDDLKGFARLDMLSTDDGVNDSTSDLLVIAGLDHMPAKNVHMMPNLYIELPDGPDPAIQARLTFYYKY